MKSKIFAMVIIAISVALASVSCGGISDGNRITESQDVESSMNATSSESSQRITEQVTSQSISESERNQDNPEWKASGGSSKASERTYESETKASTRQTNTYSEHHSEQSHHSHGGNAAKDIGRDRVVQIALSMVPGAKRKHITELEREYDDGRVEYEGEICYNGYEYEFEIDGATGNILKWEIED